MGISIKLLDIERAGQPISVFLRNKSIVDRIIHKGKTKGIIGISNSQPDELVKPLNKINEIFG